ncbi:MAG: hypothetical protein FJX31_12440 [Alphaproteobacteria bacterium]|nr:hypothetical protein [Alphaproteobacteria bacterium]
MAVNNAETPVPRADRLAGTVPEPQHYYVSSERERRSQSVHRLQLGLFGLCAALLIVGLANIIMDRAQTIAPDDPNAEVIAADAKQAQPVVDPLADAGVVPAADRNKAANPAAGATRQGDR